MLCLLYRLLNEATGSLLDDVQLVNTLQTSKVTATKVSEQLESSEQTERKIDSAREVRCRDTRKGPKGDLLLFPGIVY